MINYVGLDKNGQKLDIGDICKFVLIEDPDHVDRFEREGMIDYDEDSFSFAFEMLDPQFPIVLMQYAKAGTIEKIVNVWHTAGMKGEKYLEYQELAKANGIM
jgi:hypothetical protein